MKKLITFLIPVLLMISCVYSGADEATENNLLAANTLGYDSLLAEQMGADDYGMRTYVMALLKEGPNRGQDSLKAAQIQRAHLDNITRMAEEGTLVVAGPFMDSWEVKGIYIFAVESMEEAKALTSTDPAVQSGRLEMELHPWYGSAALMKVNELHNRISKEEI